MSAETNKEGGWRGGKKEKMWLKIRKVTDEERKLWNAHGRKREWAEEKKKLKKRMSMCVQKRGNGGLFEKSVSMKERIKRKNDQEGKMWERKENLASHLPLPQLHPPPPPLTPRWEMRARPGQVILSITPLTHWDRQALHTFGEYSQNVTLRLAGSSTVAPPVASMFPVMFLNNPSITFQGFFFFFGQSFSWSECMKKYVV